ncbi:MAG: hypothetical protein DRI56_02150 [Chloroflexota bacterium]|nr:MAG: hypothetical protein DRI56_02150 [Chloroflexota bacterium]
MKIDEEYTITELETLKVIGDPLRVQILEFVGMACESGRLPTVKQISDALELPANKLYYHVNLLEKHDLIRVAETQIVSGIIEKHYQIRAKRLLVDLNVAGTDNISRDEKMELTLASVRSMFDNAYQNIEKSFQYRYKNTPEELPEDKKNPMHYGQSILQLSPTQGKEFVTEMNALTKKYEDLKTAGGITFGLTVAFNPNYHLSTTQTEDAK